MSLALSVGVAVGLAVPGMALVWRRWRNRDREQFVHMVRAMRLSSDAVCVLDAKCRITWTNEAYGELTGYTQDELVGRPLRALLDGTVEDGSVVRAIESALEAPRELRIDLQFRRKCGEERCVVLELHPVQDVRGRRLLGHVLVQIDIDRQRREREAMLRALRDRQAVLDILDQHAIVSETDLQGSIVRVNERFAQISGYTEAELIGHNHRMVGSGRHGATFWHDMWRTVRQGRIWHGEICNRAKDGSLYWVDSVIAPMPGPDGLPARYVSIRTDITALKRGRDMLARTGRIAGVGGWHCTLETGVLDFTDAARDILGLPTRRMDMRAAVETLLPEPLQAEFLPSVQRAIVTGEPFSKDISIETAPGQQRWLRVSGEVEYLNRRPDRLVGAIQDVTALVEARLKAESSEHVLRSAIDTMDEAFALYDAQEQLVFCNDKYLGLLGDQREHVQPGMSAESILRLALRAGTYRLGDEDPEAWLAEQLRLWRQPSYKQRLALHDGRWIKSVGIITPDGMRVMFRVDITDLQIALEAADAASRSKSQFLANMSHEIRTPMNAVMGLLQLLEHTQLDPTQRDLLRKVEGSARSLLDILNDILDFSKIEAGKMRLDDSPFVLDRLLGDLSTILNGNLGDKTLELVYDIAPAVPPVLVGDALRLKQVLINLAGNAIKFTAAGQVRVQVRVLQQTPGRVTLGVVVDDTGIGIAPEALGQIFHGFSQAEASTSRRFGGTGLGLAISRRLVQLMGGDLWVESVLGQGSRFGFEVTLAVADGQRPPLPASDLVVLVEPHPGSRASLAQLLAADGPPVAAYASVATARMALAAQPGLPTLLVLCCSAPGVEALVESLHARADAAGVARPVVLLTAAHARPVAGPWPVLRKPITRSQVSAAWRDSQGGGERLAAVASTARLQGLHLLLVEDNLLNQEVALGLLGREGATVTVANNGEEGLAALAAAPDAIDLVLMDMQMPVMDGLQAARAIRQQPRHAELPIVAMTANAMASDRQACLEAGMNDHVGKPFDLDALVAVVQRYTGRGEGVLPVAAHASHPVVAEVPQDAVPVLDAATALRRLGGDPAFYGRLLRDFAAAAPALAAQLAQACQDADGVVAHHLAHQFKSTAATTGAEQLAACAALIERLTLAHRAGAEPAPTSNPRAVVAAAEPAADTLASSGAELAQALLLAVETALAAQAEWLADAGLAAPAQAPVEASAEDLGPALSALQQALEDNDMAVFDLADALIEQHGAALGEALAPLQAAMDAFDTDAALAAVVVLRASHGGTGH